MLKKQKIFLLITLLTIFIYILTGCNDGKGKLYLPEAKDDKTYTTISSEANQQIHQGKGYTIVVPFKDYRYEKDYDDNVLEETWKYIKKDDIEIKVTTYKNMDAKTAQRHFLRENDDYVFEDLQGSPLCGTDYEGDVLWFSLHDKDKNIYIISWEYPKNADDAIKAEISKICETFKVE